MNVYSRIISQESRPKKWKEEENVQVDTLDELAIWLGTFGKGDKEIYVGIRKYHDCVIATYVNHDKERWKKEFGLEDE